MVIIKMKSDCSYITTLEPHSHIEHNRRKHIDLNVVSKVPM